MSRKIVAGNWKMNMNANEARALHHSFFDFEQKDVKVILCPPSIYLSEFSKKYSGISLAAQNVSEQSHGAYTGEISASMLKSLGVEYCLVGHSERRLYNDEDNILLSKKVDQLIQHELNPIYCCGETLIERESGNEKQVIKSQLLEGLFCLSKEKIINCVIAYEPVWAIGTGVTASAEQAQEMHAFIRQLIHDAYDADIAQNLSILYGGSCKPSNATELFSKTDVDGGLIGGASLDADSFKAIIHSF